MSSEEHGNIPSVVERLPLQSDRVIVLINPHAGSGSRGELVQQLSDSLVQHGFQTELVDDVDQFSGRCESARRSGRLRAVVAAGGDGTAAMVVNRTPPGIPMAIFPLGTENLLAKYLDITADPAALCRTLQNGLTARIDAGRAGKRIFLLMAGCGFDAEVVRRLHANRRGNIRRLSYGKPILQSMRNYQYPKLRVYYDLDSAGEGTPRHIDAHWVFVVNLPRYAVGLSLAPDAVGTDGLLDLCTFKQGSFWHGLRYLTGVLVGRHQSWEDCTTARTQRLRIESDHRVPYQLDGDPGGYLPVEIEVLPGRLTLLVSEKWALK